MAEKILEIQHLKKSYGQNEVLKDISLTVEKGEVISIIGSSGSGKSTFLRSINLLETPTAGEILYRGQNVLDPEYDLTHYREKLGMVFQSFNLFENLNDRINKTLEKAKKEKSIKPSNIYEDELNLAKKLDAIEEYTIERFEENIVVLENRENQKMINVGRDKIPEGVKEGDIVRVINGKILKDEKKTEEVSERIKNKIREI